MKNKIFLTLALVVAAFTTGAVTGQLATPFSFLAASDTDAHPDDHADPHAGHDHSGHGHGDAGDEEDIVTLSQQACKNLGLKVKTIELSDYDRTLKFPAQVVERPGESTYTMASPVNGIVTAIHAVPGMRMQPNQAVFELQVIDEPLLDAQVALVDTLTRLEVIDAELRRLRPLASSGSVAGKRQLDLEYEKKELDSKQALRLQELRARGLSKTEISTILQDRQLVNRMTVRLTTSKATTSEPVSDPVYTLEELFVHPGQTVSRGDDLCHVAEHSWLYVEGQAFESDIATLSEMSGTSAAVAAEFGSGASQIVRNSLQIQYIDNHVDPNSQTFRFFVPIKNEMVNKPSGQGDGKFFTWRFKVGQRAHLIVPVQRMANQIKVPVEAVVQEGPEYFVFREHEHHDDNPFARLRKKKKQSPKPDDDNHKHGHIHDAEELEFQQIPVEVLHRDSEFAVLASDGQVQPGDRLAMNQAYQLYLALKSAGSEGGGGQHHGHSH